MVLFDDIIEIFDAADFDVRFMLGMALSRIFLAGRLGL
jgi:hypothetical protein